MKQDIKEELGFNFLTRIDVILEKTISDIEDYYKTDINDSKQYLQTGYENFCLRKGDLILLASRPCLGRFSFTMGLINNIAIKQKKAVGYFSCGYREATDICKKLISIQTAIPLTKIKEGYLNTKDVDLIKKETDKLSKSKIYINDQPNIVYEEFEFTARLMVEKLGVELIILDSYEYLEEIVHVEPEEIYFIHEKILKKYKETARELNIPILILMELPKRKDDEPSIADFKENMEIPRTVDEVFLLYRERIRDDRVTCHAKLITAKNSHGANQNILLTYLPDNNIYTNFLEVE